MSALEIEKLDLVVFHFNMLQWGMGQEFSPQMEQMGLISPIARLYNTFALMHLITLHWTRKWGSYQFRTDGHSYSITSFGADGRPGGTGNDADIQRTFACPLDSDPIG